MTRTESTFGDAKRPPSRRGAWLGGIGVLVVSGVVATIALAQRHGPTASHVAEPIQAPTASSSAPIAETETRPPPPAPSATASEARHSTITVRPHATTTHSTTAPPPAPSASTDDVSKYFLRH